MFIPGLEKFLKVHIKKKKKKGLAENNVIFVWLGIFFFFNAGNDIVDHKTY